MFNAIEFQQIDSQTLKLIITTPFNKDQFKNGIHLSLCTYRFRDMGERTYQGHHWI